MMRRPPWILPAASTNRGRSATTASIASASCVDDDGPPAMPAPATIALT